MHHCRRLSGKIITELHDTRQRLKSFLILLQYETISNGLIYSGSGSKNTYAVATPAPATAQGAPGTAAGVVATRVGSMSSGKEQFVIGKLSLGGAGGLPDHPPAVRVCLPDGRHHHGPAAHQGKWRPRGVARAAPELSVALRRHVRRFSVNVQRWKGRRRL